MCYPCYNTYNFSKEATILTGTTLLTAAVVIINIMTLFGYFNKVTTGIVNTAFYGTAALGYFYMFTATDFGSRKRCALSTTIIFATLAATMYLTIPKILSLRTAVLISLPIASLLLMGSTYFCVRQTHVAYKYRDAF